MMHTLLLASILSALIAPSLPPQEASPRPSDSKPKPAGVNDEPVVTKHEMTLGGRPIKYTATAGFLPIKSEAGEVEAHIFFIAYAREDAGDRSRRPLTFAFNGGPGSASVWLHLGALGPKRVEFPDGGEFPTPPYRLVDNESTWLDESDLVFIDPVGTGYSRAVKPELNKKFHGLQGDLDSVGEFIRLYLTRFERWGSPLFVAGESYGTTRAAGLSDRLVDRGIALNGIVLVSTVLNFQTLQPARGNDIPYALFLPTYTATAWYHKKLAPELQADQGATLREAAEWAEGDYATALMQGDRLSKEKREEIAARLAKYTGLDPVYVDRSNLRVDPSRFRKELLRDRARTVGRLDSRFVGIDEQAVTDRPEDDPSNSAIRPAYTSTFNQYIRADLGFASDLPYFILGEGVGDWDWGPSGRGYPDTSGALRDAFAKNPSLKVLVASGYYDLATPYRAAEYTLAHMGLDPSQRDHIKVEEYESGHMMYLHGPSLAKLKGDVAGFFRATLGR
ncbi:S10 family peptidase [Tundrisphaera lichenicola]|uniref:S10 family peptidase n=1 Tax=Tundrisphaera lichenicola TaxID=2029860 RepID=UPI003EB96D8C